MASNYYSKNKCGVDTVKFYRDFGKKMDVISREVGCSRHALSGFVIGKSRKDTQELILEYLEKLTQEEYIKTVENCKSKIQEIILRREQIWREYFERERKLAKLRRRYGLKRKNPLVEQKAGRDIFMESV